MKTLEPNHYATITRKLLLDYSIDPRGDEGAEELMAVARNADQRRVEAVEAARYAEKKFGEFASKVEAGYGADDPSSSNCVREMNVAAMLVGTSVNELLRVARIYWNHEFADELRSRFSS